MTPAAPPQRGSAARPCIASRSPSRTAPHRGHRLGADAVAGRDHDVDGHGHDRAHHDAQELGADLRARRGAQVMAGPERPQRLRRLRGRPHRTAIRAITPLTVPRLASAMRLMVPTAPPGLKSVSPVARAETLASTSASASASSHDQRVDAERRPADHQDDGHARDDQRAPTAAGPARRRRAPCGAAGRRPRAGARAGGVSARSAPPSSNRGSKLPASSRPSDGQTSHWLKVNRVGARRRCPLAKQPGRQHQPRDHGTEQHAGRGPQPHHRAGREHQRAAAHAQAQRRRRDAHPPCRRT